MNIHTVLSEGFESENSRVPVPWAKNVADVQLHFAGATNERALSGGQSFKLDATLNGGSYFYYQIPVRVPFWAPLKFRGHLLVEEQPDGKPEPRIQLGYAWAMPSVGESGYTVSARKINQAQNGWQEWEADLSAHVGASETAYLQGLAIYVYAPKGGFDHTRVTLFVDDFQIEGALPAGYERKIEAELKALEEENQREKAQVGQRLQDRARAVLAQMQPVIKTKLPDWAATLQTRLEEYVRHNSAQVRTDAAALQTTPDSAAATERLKATLPLLEVAVRALNALPAYAAQHRAPAFTTSIVNPMQDLRILPDSFPLAAVPGAAIEAWAAPGEYEPVSFVLTALRDLQQVQVTVAPLRREDGAQGGSTPMVDARLVKVWWQAGFNHDDTKHPTLTPELLLHDDSFVTVDRDPKTHRNTLKNPESPRDAATLQPLDIAAGTHQQFWLTIHVPENAPSGDYRTIVTIAPQNAAPVSLSLHLHVYPFRLEAPYTENAIYYRGQLVPDGAPHIGTDLKSEEQFRAELRDMKAHGVTLPSIYTHFKVLPDGSFDFAPLQRVLEIYREEGLTNGPLVLMTPIPFSAFAGKDEATQKQLLEKVRRMAAAIEEFRSKHHFPELAIYGIDEASGERLWSERAAFRVVNEVGGMMAAAVGPGFYPAVGEWLNRPIIARGQPEMYDKIRANNHKVWIYGRPMVGIEAPEVYRRSYGLMLWKRGEDGACPYAYQATDGSKTGDLYDDFSSPSYRAMAFTYPTIDGVLDTVQWEGHREGIDDVRYLTTLLKSIATARSGKDKKRARLAEQAEKWLAQTDIEGNLQAVRRDMAQWIIKLQS